MMERTSAILSFENLPEGKATVGFEVCVKHVAAAIEGSDCTVRATLREVVDGRKLRFDVEVREGERTIGVGTHQRRVIDVGAVEDRASAPSLMGVSELPADASASARSARATASRTSPRSSRPTRRCG